MKKTVLTLLLSLGFSASFACVCITQKLVDAVAYAEFIATAKISKVIPDSMQPETKIVTIELITVYKGERLTTLYINTADQTDCRFELPINSTWLFFAAKNADGTIGFGACSKSEQIDINDHDSLHYPMAQRNYERSVALKLKVLAYLRDAKINPVNPYQLSPRTEPHFEDPFLGVNVGDHEFAVYQLLVGTDLSVQQISVLKDWEDAKLKTE